jgi:hypothetical protein
MRVESRTVRIGADGAGFELPEGAANVSLAHHQIDGALHVVITWLALSDAEKRDLRYAQMMQGAPGRPQ